MAVDPTATPVDLASAVHQLESSGRMVSGEWGDGGAAAGPMQVHQGALSDVNKALGTSYTHQQLADNPTLGMLVGRKYLSMMQEMFPGRPDLALAAYNAGPGAVQKAGGNIGALGIGPQGYVAKGMALAGLPYSGPTGWYNGKASALNPLVPANLAGVGVSGAEGPAWVPKPGTTAGNYQGGMGIGQSALLPIMLSALKPGYTAIPVDYDPFKVLPKAGG